MDARVNPRIKSGDAHDGQQLAITFYDLVDKHGSRYSPYGWRVRMALAHKPRSSCAGTVTKRNWRSAASIWSRSSLTAASP